VTFHVLTIFPEFFQGRWRTRCEAGAGRGLLDIRIHNLRDWTADRHKTVDDRPFGGGEGMVLKPQPIFEAVESIWPERRPRQLVVLLSAQGRLFDQAMANRLAAAGDLLLIADATRRGRARGRTPGRRRDLDRQLRVERRGTGRGRGGGYGGAPASGVLGNETSTAFESFQETGHGEGLLDCPHWTRPAEFRGWKAPEVLLQRQPRGDPPLPAEDGDREDGAPAARFDGRAAGVSACAAARAVGPLARDPAVAYDRILRKSPCRLRC